MNSKIKPKILFIDDEERIVRSLGMMFRQTHQVYITTDPKVFLEIVQREHIHVVVSDQRMPGIGGTELLEKVRQISPNSIRILLTGYADLNAIVSSINEGEIFRYITKPWDPDELIRTVRRATEISLELIAAGVDSTAHAVTSNRREKILVLEEDGDSFEKMKDLLGSQYDLIRATDLEAAFVAIANNRFGVAIADVSFNSENVISVLGALKGHIPNLVTIVLTAVEDSTQLISLINQGQVFRCLPKPMRPYLLKISVERALSQHLKLVEAPVLALAHEVERTPELEKATSSLSSRLMGIISRFTSNLGNRYA